MGDAAKKIEVIESAQFEADTRHYLNVAKSHPIAIRCEGQIAMVIGGPARLDTDGSAPANRNSDEK